MQYAFSHLFIQILFSADCDSFTEQVQQQIILQW